MELSLLSTHTISFSYTLSPNRPGRIVSSSFTLMPLHVFRWTAPWRGVSTVSMLIGGYSSTGAHSIARDAKWLPRNMGTV